MEQIHHCLACTLQAQVELIEVTCYVSEKHPVLQANPQALGSFGPFCSQKGFNCIQTLHEPFQNLPST
jgi:hypothetical protein